MSYIPAMLLELPHLARGNLNSHQNVISRQFRKYMAGYNRQKFTGPPENTREHVMAATKCMLSGQSVSHIHSHTMHTPAANVV